MKKCLLIIFVLILKLSMFGQLLLIPDGTVFNVPSNMNLILSGTTNLVVNSADVNFEGNVKFISSEEQSIGGTTPVEITNLYIENNGLTLDNNLAISSELDMQRGIINIQDNELTIKSVADITGNFANDCMIVKDDLGIFQREVAGNGTYIFPVGDILATYDYSPVELELLNGTYSEAKISVTVENSKYSQNNSTENYLNRYWELSTNGIINPEYNINLNYVSDDVVGDESLIYGVIYTTEWNILNPISSNTISATNISDFGIFTGGDQTLVNVNNFLSDEVTIIGIEDGLKINTSLKVLKVDVFNALGQNIFQQEGLTSNKIKLNRNLGTAIYLVRIITNKGIYSGKVLIY